MRTSRAKKSAGRLVDVRRSIAKTLVANLSRDVVELFGLAVAALRTKQCGTTTRARSTASGEGAQHRGQVIRLEQHLRVLDRHFVEHLIALAREALGDLHVLGVEEAAAREPRLGREADRLDHERVSVPVADGMTRVFGLAGLLWVERAAVGRDHAQVRIAAAAIAA